MDQNLSSAPSHPKRLSHEGLLLIKSFAGFRPQAVRRRDGVLTIGYGHSQTARPGITISEQEAELLLLHDLIPVIDAIHIHVKAPLNPHQFDALASFILSIGVERFTSSDVLDHLNRHDTARASQAMTGWPDRVPPPVDAPYRRRSAERALFEAKPDQRVELGQLLTAPVSPQTSKTIEPGTVHAATIPVVRHPDEKTAKHDAADYGALGFIAAIGTLALVAGYLSFRRDLPPSQPGDGAIIVGVGLIIAGSIFIAAALWNLLQKRNNRLFI
jgi:lysozyme